MLCNASSTGIVFETYADMHRRKDLPFDYICIQAMRNVQYTAVSQQIRLLIEGLLSGSQQGLMDRGQSPIETFWIKLSLFPHLLLQPSIYLAALSDSYKLLLCLKLNIRTGTFPHISFIGEWLFWWNACFMWYCMYLYECKKYVKLPLILVFCTYSDQIYINHICDPGRQNQS